MIMKVYVLMECDIEKKEDRCIDVFRKFDSADSSASFFANEKVKGYSQTRIVEKYKDGYYIVRYYEEGQEVEGEVISIYYVLEKLLINN